MRRDEKLSHLDARAQDLQYGAQSFKSGASKLKRKVFRLLSCFSGKHMIDIKTNQYKYVFFIRFKFLTECCSR